MPEKEPANTVAMDVKAVVEAEGIMYAKFCFLGSNCEYFHENRGYHTFEFVGDHFIKQGSEMRNLNRVYKFDVRTTQDRNKTETAKWIILRFLEY